MMFEIKKYLKILIKKNIKLKNKLCYAGIKLFFLDFLFSLFIYLNYFNAII